eukprot:COSAG02_NODE_5776_length_4040_cov_7.535126_2_plen_220_part_00
MAAVRESTLSHVDYCHVLYLTYPVGGLPQTSPLVAACQYCCSPRVTRPALLLRSGHTFLHRLCRSHVASLHPGSVRVAAVGGGFEGGGGGGSFEAGIGNRRSASLSCPPQLVVASQVPSFFFFSMIDSARSVYESIILLQAWWNQYWATRHVTVSAKSWYRLSQASSGGELLIQQSRPSCHETNRQLTSSYELLPSAYLWTDSIPDICVVHAHLRCCFS